MKFLQEKFQNFPSNGVVDEFYISGILMYLDTQQIVQSKRSLEWVESIGILNPLIQTFGAVFGCKSGSV